MAKTTVHNSENLKKVLDYMIMEEVNHFEESYLDDMSDTEEDGEVPLDLDEAIKFCEDGKHTGHILYNLLILKKELGEKTSIIEN